MWSPALTLARPSGPLALLQRRVLQQPTVLASLLFLAGCLNGLFWTIVHPERIVEGTDSAWYHLLARNLAEGHGFSLDAGQPYAPTMYREIGYPLFIATVYRLVGIQPDVVVVVQVALLGTLAVLTFLLASAVVGGRLAPALAGLLVALAPDHGEMSRQLLSESLYTPFFVLVLLVALVARQTGRGGWYLAAGIAFGLAALIRVQGGALFGALAVLWFFQEWRERKRLSLARMALLAVGFGVIVAPWLARNFVTFGVPSLAQRYGAAVAPRAAKAAYPAEFYATWARAAAWVAFNPLSDLVYPMERFQYGRLYWDNEIWDFHTTLSARLVMVVGDACERASTDPGALARARQLLPITNETVLDLVGYQARYENCALQFGLELIRDYPLQYLLQTPFEWVKLNFYPLPSKLAAYRNSLIWVALASLAWLAARRKLRGHGLWLAFVLLAFNLVAVPFDTAERYIIPALPLYATFAAAGLAHIFQRWGRSAWARLVIGPARST